MPTNFTVVPVDDCTASGSNYDEKAFREEDEQGGELMLGPFSGKQGLFYMSTSPLYTRTSYILC